MATIGNVSIGGIPYYSDPVTSMHSCFFGSGSPRRRQALHSGGGVTVVSRGDSQVRAKIVVSRGELDRIAAGVTRRQCSWIVPLAVSLGERQAAARAPPRSELEEGAGAARRSDTWRPALDGIPEEA